MRRFWTRVACFLAPFAAVLALPVGVMFQSGELTRVDDVVDRQLGAEPVLFGLAYSNPVKYYKARALARRRPHVLALGSSRVMQLRAALFATPDFYNAGGAVATVWDFRRVLRRLDPADPPQTLLLGLDQWMFNPRWGDRADVGERDFMSADSVLNIVQRRWYAVYRDLWQGKIDLPRLMRARGPDVGLNAVLNEKGFRNDGSYLYGDVVYHPEKCEPAGCGFDYTFERIAKGEQRFEWNDRVDAEAVAEIDRVLDAAAGLGMRVVGFLPPFPPAVLERMRAAGRYAYLADIAGALRPTFSHHGFALFDFTDVGPLGATDAEFVDGFHGSEKTYVRMVLVMARETPALAGLVDVPRLERGLAGADRFQVALP